MCSLGSAFQLHMKHVQNNFLFFYWDGDLHVILKFIKCFPRTKSHILTKSAGIVHGKGHITLAHNLTTLTKAMDFYKTFKVFLKEKKKKSFFLLIFVYCNFFEEDRETKRVEQIYVYKAKGTTLKNMTLRSYKVSFQI